MSCGTLKQAVALTARSVASVSHQVATHIVTAAILVTSTWPGDKSAKNKVKKNAAGPAINAIRLAGFT
jgi:hypothetical protein